MSQARLIGHLDVDAFYVAVECARRPELAGQPVVVAGSGPRSVVTTASYAARKFGVGSAMPTARARRLCPQAHFLPPDFPTYKAVSAKLFEIVRDHVAIVQVMGLDEAYLELTGRSFAHAAMRALLAEIRAETALSCSVGIGPNKLVAKVASDAEKPEGFVSLTRRQACERFAGAPPRLIPGIGPKCAERLRRLGITTIAALRAADLDALSGSFSARAVEDLLRRASFLDESAVQPDRPTVSESCEQTFDQDIAGAEELQSRLTQMVERLCRRLAEHGRSGRTVSIKVRCGDFSTFTRARSLPRPTNELQAVEAIASQLLAENLPGRPVRLLGVRMSALSGPGTAAAAAGSPAPGLPRSGLAEASIDQLALPLS